VKIPTLCILIAGFCGKLAVDLKNAFYTNWIHMRKNIETVDEFSSWIRPAPECSIFSLVAQGLFSLLAYIEELVLGFIYLPSVIAQSV
jgi:hypothetical protein